MSLFRRTRTPPGCETSSRADGTGALNDDRRKTMAGCRKICVNMQYWQLTTTAQIRKFFPSLKYRLLHDSIFVQFLPILIPPNYTWFANFLNHNTCAFQPSNYAHLSQNNQVLLLQSPDQCLFTSYSHFETARPANHSNPHDFAFHVAQNQRFKNQMTVNSVGFDVVFGFSIEYKHLSVWNIKQKFSIQSKDCKLGLKIYHLQISCMSTYQTHAE